MFRSVAVVMLDEPPADGLHILFAVQRVMRRSWPGRNRAADRPVMVEGGLQYALTTGECRQLLGQLVHSSCWDFSLEQTNAEPRRTGVAGCAPSRVRAARMGPSVSAGNSRRKL